MHSFLAMCLIFIIFYILRLPLKRPLLDPFWTLLFIANKLKSIIHMPRNHLMLKNRGSMVRHSFRQFRVLADGLIHLYLLVGYFYYTPVLLHWSMGVDIFSTSFCKILKIGIFWWQCHFGLFGSFP